MKDLYAMVLVLVIILLGFRVNKELDDLTSRYEHAEATQAKNAVKQDAKLYVAKNPAKLWTEINPDGVEIRCELFGAVREGEVLWVLRKDGEYLETDSEYTTDALLSFDEGMDVMVRQDSYWVQSTKMSFRVGIEEQ